MFSDGTFSYGMFSDGTFSDGTLSYGMFSDGTFSDRTFCMSTITSVEGNPVKVGN